MCMCITYAVDRVDYNHTEAEMYAISAALSYCPPTRVMGKNWNRATELADKFGLEPIHAYENGEDINRINYTILRRPANNEIIVSFSGTCNNRQLLSEFVRSYPVDYSLHEELKGAKVVEYFYWYYLNNFRQDFQKALHTYIKDHPKSRVVFTGHSLGGAMSVHAAVDAVLSGWIKRSQMLVYTFGQPRVGNHAFTDILANHTLGIYRVINGRDIVPHLPPWISFVNLQGWYGEGILPYYPYHSPVEVWYKDGFDAEFKLCSGKDGEDSECSNQNGLFNVSINDHVNYFGNRLGSMWMGDDVEAPIPELELTEIFM